MDGFRTFWNGLEWSALADMVFAVLPALVCITLHELAHGYVAYRLGDRTAKNAGRLTLNPIRHIDWFGLLMMVSQSQSTTFSRDEKISLRNPIFRSSFQICSIGFISGVLLLRKKLGKSGEMW